MSRSTSTTRWAIGRAPPRMSRATAGSGAPAHCQDARAARYASLDFNGDAPGTAVVRLAAATHTVSYGADLLSTRCAGPLESDIAAVLPTRALPVQVLRKGSTTIDLSATSAFAAAGMAGTVRSSVVLRLGRPRVFDLDALGRASQRAGAPAQAEADPHPGGDLRGRAPRGRPGHDLRRQHSAGAVPPARLLRRARHGEGLARGRQGRGRPLCDRPRAADAAPARGRARSLPGRPRAGRRDIRGASCGRRIRAARPAQSLDAGGRTCTDSAGLGGGTDRADLLAAAAHGRLRGRGHVRRRSAPQPLSRSGVHRRVRRERGRGAGLGATQEHAQPARRAHPRAGIDFHERRVCGPGTGRSDAGAAPGADRERTRSPSRGSPAWAAERGCG